MSPGRPWRASYGLSLSVLTRSRRQYEEIERVEPGFMHSEAIYIDEIRTFILANESDWIARNLGDVPTVPEPPSIELHEYQDFIPNKHANYTKGGMYDP